MWSEINEEGFNHHYNQLYDGETLLTTRLSGYYLFKVNNALDEG